MKKQISYVLSIFFLVQMSSTPVFANKAEPVTTIDSKELITRTELELKDNTKHNKPIELKTVENREIVVKGKIDPDTLKAAGVVLVETMRLPSLESTLYTCKIPNDLDYEAVLNLVKELEGVELAEPNYKLKTNAVPNDVYFSKQWSLPALQIPKAWDTFQFPNEIKVAVLDTGVNKSHPDLAGKVLPGYDFVNKDTDPADDHGHGTSVAGVIAAISNNREGIAGINQNVKIIPVKISNSSGYSTIQDAIKGINYAIAQGADIINMSYGSYYFSDIENEALWNAYDQGITLIAAAGNNGKSEPMYPASYTPVISVAASSQSGTLTSFSNRGNWIDISSPGEQIYTLSSLGGYSIANGTSFSAPIASGVASLLMSANPNLSPMEIQWAMELGATTGKWQPDTGFGVLNAFNSLTMKLPSTTTDIPDTREGAMSLGFNQVYKEKIDHPYDLDVYHIKVDNNSKLTININGFSSDLDVYGELKKADGTTYTTVGHLDNSGLGQAEAYSFVAAPGDYYLILSDYYNHWSQTPYQISVQLNGENIPVQSPKATIPSGTYSNPLEIGLETEAAGSIVYTLDGTVPTKENGYVYNEPISVYETATLKAAVISGTASSEVSTFTYKINGMEISNVSLPGTHKHPVARVIIRRDDLVMYKKNSDNTFSPYRILSKGEQLKVFGVSGHYYNVGGPYYVRHEEGKTIAYIGRALIKQTTPLYDTNSNVYRDLQKGEAIKVYSYNEQSYEVGGGYTIKVDKNSHFIIGYVKPKRDITLYTPQGSRHSTLTKGNLYYVKKIDNGKLDLGNGYYVLDNKEDFDYIKN